jgi:hypothetical protein
MRRWDRIAWQLQNDRKPAAKPMIIEQPTPT